MDRFNEKNMAEHKLWKKVLCVFLSILIAFGTFVVLTVGSSRLQDLLGIQSMLSAYAAEIVDTKAAVAVDEESMLADHHIIDLENRDGSNTVYLFSEPISYTDENGNLKTKDISVEKQADKELRDKGYEFTNGQNDYRINFSADSDKGLLIRFEDYTYSIIPQGKFQSEGKKSISAFLNENFDVFEYENIYGEGTNLKFYPQLNGVKDEIVLNSNIGQNIFSFELKTENCTAVLNEDGTVSLIDKDNNEVQSFQAPFAYDCEYISGVNDEHYSLCKYDLKEISQGNYLLSITVNSDWLNADTTSYPVTIDPTTSHISNMYDLPIHTKRTTTGATVDNNAVGTSTELGTSRTLVKFQKPSEIKAYAKINSAYYWTRELTGRTSNFTCGIYKITSSWNENNLWSTRPTYNGTQITARNINSASTDSSTNPHWYKFNITSLVQQWYTGTTNYGFMMKYENETAATKNLRTFAQQEYSASYCQPYTVINYTNDTTAPTVTSVTGNPTAWTNNNVTLTINGAKDNSGGAGLHATPYSFSTTKGSYSWQSGNTKTFSSNCTVYVYVRDKLGNIRLVSTQTINKIDKTKPSAPTVTGNAAEWTNSNVTLSASSSDSQSGIAAYSFSTTEGSYSWQTEKNKTYSENTTVYVYAKDNAGNISAATKVVIDKITSDPEYLIEPIFYKDNQLVGIYNPRSGKENIQYKIGENGEWINYTVPFALPLHQNVTVYAKFESSQNPDISSTFSSMPALIGAYTESNTDFSLTYKNTSFDFIRAYDSTDKKWFFATDSSISIVNDYVISAVLPDSTKFTFVKTADNIYTNEINGYTLTRNDNGYIILIDGVSYSYDTDGKLISVSNKYDDTITIARTSSSITISDNAGRAYTLALDSNGKIISATDPVNNVITYTYDNNNLTKVVDQAGVTIGQYSYTNGVLTKSMDKTIKYGTDGRVTSYEYDSGAYLNYSYDDENKTISTESSVETTTSQTYNDALMIVSSTDEEDNTTEFTYDEYYRTLTETKNGQTITYNYDNKGNVLSEVSDDEDAENTYYTYDNNGNVIRQQTGTNYTYYLYDESGELSLTATLKDDYSGEIPNVYNSDLTCFDTVSYTYDNGILVKTVDNKEKETITNTYDEYGNSIKVSTVTEKDDESTVGTVDNTYDIMGNILTSVSGEETSSYIYDKAGRTLLANEKGDCTRTIYDNLGRTIQEISSEDYDSTKDALPEENTYSDSTAGQTYVYAANGTLTSETNRLGKTTKYFYNDIGSKVREEFDIYKFYYLNHGELYQVKVAGTTTVSYNYDNDFKLLSESYANDDTIRYTYNDNGDVTAQYHNSNAKPYVIYTYNEDNELTEKVNTDTGLKYVYGENNSVSVYKTSDNTLVQSYTETETEADEANNITAKTDITENHFGTTYSSVVKDKSISYTTGSDTIEYSYQTTGSEEDEKVSSDTVKNGDITALSSAYTYDDDGNITNKQYSYKIEGEAQTVAFVNEYDDKGKITATGYDSVSEYYTYDSNDQLVRVDSSTYNFYTSTFSYDSRGNITSKNVYDYTRSENITSSPKETTTFTYANSGWKDLLVSVNGVELTYDEVGNVLTYGDKEFTWNTGRNLAQITDGDNTYSYTYDESGIRTSKTVNGITTYYNTKDGVILSQSDGTNTMYFQYDTNGAPLGFIYNGVQYFYFTNQMGDVIALSDSDGNVFAEYTYDAWGSLQTINTADEDNEEQLTIANANPLRYRGYYYDNETGYYYLQSRYYDASICRFINADVYCNTGTKSLVSTNMYAYCDNSPVDKIDFDGFWGMANHYNWTYAVAKECGYSASIAIKIAKNCSALDKVYPSTAYVRNFTLHQEEKEWQYYHFNKYKYGNKDSRTEYADKWLSKAIREHYMGRYNYAYMWLGYALHCLQDIEAHGQIDRGDIVPDHLGNVNGDNRGKADSASGYEWTNNNKNRLKYVRNSKKRQNAAKSITKKYIKRFRAATR